MEPMPISTNRPSTCFTSERSICSPARSRSISASTPSLIGPFHVAYTRSRKQSMPTSRSGASE